MGTGIKYSPMYGKRYPESHWYVLDFMMYGVFIFFSSNKDGHEFAFGNKYSFSRVLTITGIATEKE